MCAPCSPLCKTLLKARNACLLTFFFCASRSMEPPTLRMSKFFISNIWSSPQSVVLWHRACFQSRHALSWMALLATCPLQVLTIEKSLQKFKQPLVCYIAGSRNWCSKNSVAKLLWSPEESSVWSWLSAEALYVAKHVLQIQNSHVSKFCLSFESFRPLEGSFLVLARRPVKTEWLLLQLANDHWSCLPYHMQWHVHQRNMQRHFISASVSLKPLYSYYQHAAWMLWMVKSRLAIISHKGGGQSNAKCKTVIELHQFIE